MATTARRAFTLIELLVVIAIISILISLLLPAVGSVKRLGKQLVSTSNIRQLALAFNAYAGDYQGWLPGSPSTSGYDCLPSNDDPDKGYLKDDLHPSTFNGTAMQTFDFMGPIAEYVFNVTGPGRSQPIGSDAEDDVGRSERWRWMREIEAFRDPTNNYTAVGWDGDSIDESDELWPAGPMLSYFTSTQFTTDGGSDAHDIPPPFGAGKNGYPYQWPERRAGYKPRLDKVGSVYMKIALFEGHRYMDSVEGAEEDYPDADISIAPTYGGGFSGAGAWLKGSNELNRDVAPGEYKNAAYVNFGYGTDLRPYGFRHGTRRSYQPGQSSVTAEYLANVGFFDGHAKTMNDQDITNPDMWFPTNTEITSSGEFYNIIKERWGKKFDDISEDHPYIVP